MVDTRTPQKRSEIMAAVRSKSTGPEVQVRRLIYGMGYRYRLHDKRLPGTPDIVMVGRRKVIEVYGCFWHGHQDCRYGRLPKSRHDFWKAKVERNRERDAENVVRLTDSGWKVLVIWQCELKQLDVLKKKLYAFIES